MEVKRKEFAPISTGETVMKNVVKSVIKLFYMMGGSGESPIRLTFPPIR